MKKPNKHVIYDEGQRVPIKIWSDIKTVEESAIKQLKNIAGLPFVFKHVSAMPDVHLGKGATVGSVIATKNAVIPAAVGVDIGCGMMAIKTKLDYRVVRDNIKKIRISIERSIPLGPDGNRRITDTVINWGGWGTYDNIHAIKNYKRDMKQTTLSKLGSLGGGNHFIEICLDKENAVWIMLHSGSRNIGKTVADIHINQAKDLMKKMFIDLPDPDLAYFARQTKEYDHYMEDLMWCQEYAKENRIEMMRRVMTDVSYAVGLGGKPLDIELEVNCHHNYANYENHYEENVLLTRKGAVSAKHGEYGIIPGSMGTKSYIVKGLGNKESFCSCSHGAGRKMSRTEARRQFTIEDLALQTNGVECKKDDSVLDEIPSSYKDIDVVMENQKDLVEVVAELKQIMCIKG